ncbi:MAG: tetratricopeptide repeat protein [Acidobacteriota bacterium]
MNRPSPKVTTGATLLFLAALFSGCRFADRLKARDHLNRGVKAYSAEKYEQAIQHFNAAIELDPELTDAFLYLATTYRAQWIPGANNESNLQRADRAIRTFEEVLEKAPGGSAASINATANIAGIYGGLEQPDKAKEWYLKRLEIEPNNAEPYYGIGTIDWKIAHDKTGNNGDNADNLSDEERERVAALVDEGVESLKKALEIDPEYSEAMQYLNLLYRERAYLSQDEEEKGSWQKEALKLALRALEIKRKQEAEAERARRTFTGAAEHN